MGQGHMLMLGIAELISLLFGPEKAEEIKKSVIYMA